MRSSESAFFINTFLCHSHKSLVNWHINIIIHFEGYWIAKFKWIGMCDYLIWNSWCSRFFNSYSRFCFNESRSMAKSSFFWLVTFGRRFIINKILFNWLINISFKLIGLMMMEIQILICQFLYHIYSRHLIIFIKSIVTSWVITHLFIFWAWFINAFCHGILSIFVDFLIHVDFMLIVGISLFNLWKMNFISNNCIFHFIIKSFGSPNNRIKFRLQSWLSSSNLRFILIIKIKIQTVFTKSTVIWWIFSLPIFHQIDFVFIHILNYKIITLCCTKYIRMNWSISLHCLTWIIFIIFLDYVIKPWLLICRSSFLLRSCFGRMIIILGLDKTIFIFVFERFFLFFMRRNYVF